LLLSSETPTTILSNNFNDFLTDRRKYFVVIIFTFAAILTPPDPITQIGLALPLLLLLFFVRNKLNPEYILKNLLDFF